MRYPARISTSGSWEVLRKYLDLIIQLSLWLLTSEARPLLRDTDGAAERSIIDREEQWRCRLCAMRSEFERRHSLSTVPHHDSRWRVDFTS